MIYTLTGDDSGRITQRVTTLSSGLDEAFGSLNRLEVTTLDEAIATARMFPFGGGDRVTIFRAPPKWNPPDEFQPPFLPDNSILILVVSKLDGRKKFGKTLKKIGKVENYPLLSQWDIKGQTDLVEQQAELLGAQLQRGVAEQIALAIGADTRRIEQSLQQLASYCNGPITQSAVDECLIQTTQTGLDLAESVIKCDRATAFKLLKELTDLGNHPLQLLAVLINRVSKVFVAKAIPGDAAAELAGLSNPKQLYYLRKSPASVQQLQALMERLLAAETEIKSGMDGVIALEKVVAGILA